MRLWMNFGERNNATREDVHTHTHTHTRPHQAAQLRRGQRSTEPYEFYLFELPDSPQSPCTRLILYNWLICRNTV